MSEPPTAQVGQFFRVASIDADSHYVLEAVDAPQGGVTDVIVGKSSVVGDDGIANIVMAPSRGGKYGVVAINADIRSGFTYSGFGELVINRITDAQISTRKEGNAVGIRLDHLDKAVKAAMCDGKGAAWTPEEQAAAQERIGILSTDGEVY